MELACSTTLVPAYHPDLLHRLVDVSARDDRRATLVFIVCGGFKIDMQAMAEYQRLLEQDPGETWAVKVDDGELINVRK